MYVTATSHLPAPIASVEPVVLAGDLPWFPELVPAPGHAIGVAGARARLDLGTRRRPAPVELATVRRRRSTVTLAGVDADGRDLELVLSLSPWDGGTVVVLTIDDGDRWEPLRTWRVARRLRAALTGLGDLLAPRGVARGTRGAVGSATVERMEAHGSRGPA